MKPIKGGGKEVVWDEDNRVNYLTGFKKRKNERRKFGLAMQIMKEAKAKKEVLKGQRAQIIKANKKEKDKLEELQGNENEETSHEQEECEEEDDEKGEEEGSVNDSGDEGKRGEVYNDKDTTAMFGGGVSVIVNEHMDTVREESDEEDVNSEEWKRAKERLVKRRSGSVASLFRALREQ